MPGVAELMQEVPETVAAMGPLGSLYFFGVYVVTQLLVVVPCMTVTATSGYIFGVPMGFGLALAGSMASATAGFFLSRTILQPQVMRLAEGNEAFSRISRAVDREGFKIVLLSRMALVLPFAPLNFAFGGLSNVSFKDFFLGTFLPFTPEVLAVVYFASSARSVLGESAGEPWYVYAVGGAVVFCLLHQIAEIARGALDEAVEDGETAGTVLE